VPRLDMTIMFILGVAASVIAKDYLAMRLMR
jgi:hypothetical protein